MRIIGKIFNRIKLCYYQSSSDRYIKFLKKKGLRLEPVLLLVIHTILFLTILVLL